MRKRRILSLLLAVAVTATMLIAVPLTASAASVTDLTAVPDTITKIVFGASSYDGATQETFANSTTANSLSDQKHFLVGNNNKGSNLSTNKRTLKIDGNNHDFTNTYDIKNKANNDISNTDKILAFKPSKACWITVYGYYGSDKASAASGGYLTYRNFEVYHKNKSNSYITGTSTSVNDDNNSYNEYKFYSYGTDPIYLGADTKTDAYICMIEFDWTSPAPQGPSEVSVKIKNGSQEAKTADAYLGESLTLTADVTLPEELENTSVNWSHTGDITCQEDGNNITITATSENGTASVTATSVQDSSKSATCDITLHKSPRVKGEEGGVEKLVAPTESEIYDLLDEALNTEGEKSGFEPYQKNKIYFNNHVAAVGNDSNNGNAYSNKTSYDIDETINDGQGISIEQDKFLFAVKLNKGTIIKTMITSTGSSPRHGTISSTQGYEGDLAKTVDLDKSPAHGIMSYTAVKDNDIVYISSSGGCSISQIQVIVPDTTKNFGEGKSDSGWYNDAESAKKGVIRFLQQYVGSETVEKYGFYFVNDKGAVENAVLSEEGEITGQGLYADLIDIDSEKGTGKYYAMAFVVIDGDVYYSDSIPGQVEWGDEYHITDMDLNK